MGRDSSGSIASRTHSWAGGGHREVAGNRGWMNSFPPIQTTGWMVTPIPTDIPKYTAPVLANTGSVKGQRSRAASRQLTAQLT